MKPSTIAIDGPAASGKSTIGEQLARRLGYLFFDTGVMYRAVTWAALDRGISVLDEVAVTALAERLRIDVTSPTVEDGRPYTVLADGVDVTWEIRTPAVNDNVSTVSAYGGVREAMVRHQRRVAEHRRVAGNDRAALVVDETEAYCVDDNLRPEPHRERAHLRQHRSRLSGKFGMPANRHRGNRWQQE